MFLTRRLPYYWSMVKGTKNMSIIAASRSMLLPFSPRFMFCAKAA
jgi:hypothetical protein